MILKQLFEQYIKRRKTNVNINLAEKKFEFEIAFGLKQLQYEGK
jgi:hypothetical protein